jgi:hypothetical protein
MRTHQFTLAFLQVTSNLPEEIRQLILNTIEPTPPPAPMKPQTPQAIFKGSPRRLLF